MEVKRWQLGLLGRVKPSALRQALRPHPNIQANFSGFRAIGILCLIAYCIYACGCLTAQENVTDSRKSIVAQRPVPAGEHCNAKTSSLLKERFITYGDTKFALVRNSETYSKEASLQHDDFVTHGVALANGYATRTSGGGHIFHWSRVGSGDFVKSRLMIDDPGSPIIESQEIISDESGTVLAVVGRYWIRLFRLRDDAFVESANVPFPNGFLPTYADYEPSSGEFIVVDINRSRTLVLRVPKDSPSAMRQESLPVTHYAKAIPGNEYVLIQGDGRVHHQTPSRSRSIGKLPLGRGIWLRVRDFDSPRLYVSILQSLYAIDLRSNSISHLWDAPVGQINAVIKRRGSEEIICGYGLPNGYLVTLRQSQ